MGFSGIGIWEILVILVVAFLVLGPTKVPGVARKLGQTIRAIKKASNELTTSLTREIESNEAEKPRSHLKPENAPAVKETPQTTGETPPPAEKPAPPAGADQPTTPGEKHQDD